MTADIVMRTFGDVAQLVEHLLCKQKVVGSIPIVSTDYGPGSDAAGAVPVRSSNAAPAGTPHASGVSEKMGNDSR